MDENFMNILVNEIKNDDFVGVISMMQAYFNGAIDIDKGDSEGNTILHISAANCCTKIVNKILANGGSVDAKNHLGWTPLMQAARFGHTRVIYILLNYGAGVNIRNKYGMTALMLASASGYIDAARALLENGAIYNSNLSVLGQPMSPMMVAALFGKNNILRLFLDKRVNANETTPESDISPLMCAAAGGDLISLEMLMGRAAKPFSVNSGSFSAFDVASSCNNTEAVQLLKQHVSKTKRRGNTDIFEVIKSGDLNHLQELLSSDPSLAHTLTEEGASPLIVAAMLNEISVAQLLLQCGANINAQDYVIGWTPLMQAIYHRNSQMALYLIRSGADINIESTEGSSAFDVANDVMDFEVLKVFASIHEDFFAKFSCHGFNSKVDPSSSGIFKDFFRKLWRGNSSMETNKKNSSGRKNSFSILTGSPNYKTICMDIVGEEDLSYEAPIFSEMSRDLEKALTDSAPPPKDSDTDIVIVNPPGIKSKEKFRERASQPFLNRENPSMDINHNLNGEYGSAFNKKIPKIRINDDSAAVGFSTSLEHSDLSSSDINLTHDKYRGTETRNLNNLSTQTMKTNSTNYDDISTVLEKIGLKSRIEAFREQEIDLEVFPLLNREDLRGLVGSGTQRIQNAMEKVEELKRRGKYN